MPELDHATAEELGAERNAAGPRPHFVPQTPDYPLGLLHDRQFEVLCHDLLEAAATPDQGYVPRLMPYGADRGRDVVLYRDGQVRGVAQCKRYDKGLSQREVVTELFKFLLFARRDRRLLPDAEAFEYQLWTSRDLGETGGDFFVDPRKALLALGAAEASRWVEAARKRAVALTQTAPDGLAPEDEAVAVLGLAEQLTYSHVGPRDIAKRLIAAPKVRRWFFRSPDDATARPTEDQVETLMLGYRRLQSAQFSRAGQSGEAPYVPNPRLDAAFTAFLQAQAKVFVLVGGSGRGKSTWAARLAAAQGPKVDIVRGDDIDPSDDNVVATLARVLGERPLHGVPSADLRDATWRWMDQENRLIVVDGLDRAPSLAREAIPRWIRNSVALAALTPARLVFTCRIEAWRSWAPQLGEAKADIFHPDAAYSDVPASAELVPLDDEEAERVYRAYGLDPGAHGRRPLRSPSLIRLYARQATPTAAPTRLEILAAAVDDARDDAMHTTSRIAADLFLQHLGRELYGAEDARIELARAVAPPHSMEIVDAFVRTDLLRQQGLTVRPELDEVAEFLCGAELDIPQALADLPGRGDQPLFLGALAMAVAKLESTSGAKAKGVVEELLKDASASEAAFEAAARILSELRDHDAVEPLVRQLIGLWNRKNLFLFVSNLESLLAELRLPAATRIDLIMQLARHEESDDWRDKYWLDPDLPGRMISAFGHLATRIVREAPAETAPILFGLLGADKVTAQVAGGLICEAAAANASGTLAAANLAEPGVVPVLSVLLRLQPIAASAYLAHQLPTAKIDSARLVELLCSGFDAVSDHPSASKAIAEAMSGLVAIVPDHLAARLRLRLALADPSPEAIGRALALRAELSPIEFPSLAYIDRATAEMALDEMFQAILDRSHLVHALEYLNHAQLPPEVDFTGRASAAFDAAGVQGRTTIALATERALHVEDRITQSGPLWQLAEKMASSPDREVRRPMVFYAGFHVARKHPHRAAVIAARDQLLQVLVEVETGDTLHDLVRKLIETSSERADAEARLNVLKARFSESTVEQHAELWRRLQRFKPHRSHPDHAPD